jgi:hypothetical protein
MMLSFSAPSRAPIRRQKQIHNADSLYQNPLVVHAKTDGAQAVGADAISAVGGVCG